MKLTEKQPIQLPQSKLEAFSKRKFNLELNGFEVLALYKVAGLVGGIGKIRSVFSWCKDDDRGHNLRSTLEGIEGLCAAENELKYELGDGGIIVDGGYLEKV